ncbi:MAG: glutaminase [Pseudanabaenales cyanobacterium]|nr:glutaminase [Pseudanabaenales cyanobacterium]
MSPLQTFLDDLHSDDLHSRYRTLDKGRVASYIPELAKADPTGLASVWLRPMDRSLKWATYNKSSPSNLFPKWYTCGMYNRAGEWAYRVGVPAKSGVSGGMIAVVPGKAGIAAFSPPIDPNGNSVRGVCVFEELSQKYGLHLFDLSMGRCVFTNALK